MSAPGMVDMRHTKLSAEDAALIAGEVVKPSWASRNEGIHERISFDDTLWGFDLAGGSFYKTPLRVVNVKPGSRAEQASIRKGDTVLKINGIDTSTLTLQEAHDIILESGIHLKISVTAPEDEVDAYYTYEDPIAEASRLAEELRRAMEAERIRRAIERAQRSCNLPWPWVRRKIIIYRESNCFLVPSTYESKHKEKYPELPHVRFTDDICEINRGTQIEPKRKNDQNSQEPVKEEPVKVNEEDFDKLSSVMDEKEQNKIIDEILEEKENKVEKKNIPSDVDETSHSDIETAPSVIKPNGENLDPEDEEPLIENSEEIINEVEEQVPNCLEPEIDSTNETLEEDNGSQEKEEIETETNNEEENNSPSQNEENEEVIGEEDTTAPTSDYIEEDAINNEVENNTSSQNEENEEVIGGEEDTIAPTSDYIEEDAISKSEEDNVVDGIVGNGDLNDSTNER